MDENVIPVNPKKKSRLKPAALLGVAVVFFHQAEAWSSK